MCIIIVKDGLSPIPDNNILEEAMSNNKDGAGYCFWTPEGIQLRKGFMTKTAFFDQWKKDAEAMESTTVIFHSRIASHGGVSPGLTHPFPVHPEKQAIHEQERLCLENVLAHNGATIGPFASTYEEGESDTSTFVRRWWRLLKDPKNWEEQLDELIGHNKIALMMQKTGIIKMWGTFYEINKGLWASNESYKPTPVSHYYDTTKTAKDRYQRWKDGKWVDYYDAKANKYTGYCPTYQDYEDDVTDVADMPDGVQYPIGADGLSTEAIDRYSTPKTENMGMLWDDMTCPKCQNVPIPPLYDLMEELFFYCEDCRKLWSEIEVVEHSKQFMYTPEGEPKVNEDTIITDCDVTPIFRH